MEQDVVIFAIPPAAQAFPRYALRLLIWGEP